MPKQLSCKALLWKLNEHDLKTISTGELHHRKAVGVAGDQYNPVYSSTAGIGGDVEAKPHVDTLLFEFRLKVVVR